jgi:tyrosyl-tRNA synthetase
LSKNNFPPIDQQMELIKRGTSEIIPEEEVVEKLKKAEK